MDEVLKRFKEYLEKNKLQPYGEKSITEEEYLKIREEQKEERRRKYQKINTENKENMRKFLRGRRRWLKH